MLRLTIGSFLIAHGLIHAAIWLPQAFGVRASTARGDPFDPGYSWLVSTLSAGGGRWLSVTLALSAAIGFVAAGTGLFAYQGWWRPLTVAASVVSLVLFLLYFNPWLSAAVLINVALVSSLLVMHWPPAAWIGT